MEVNADILPWCVINFQDSFRSISFSDQMLMLISYCIVNRICLQSLICRPPPTSANVSAISRCFWRGSLRSLCAIFRSATSVVCRLRANLFHACVNMKAASTPMANARKGQTHRMEEKRMPHRSRKPNAVPEAIKGQMHATRAREICKKIILSLNQKICF